MLPDFLLCFCGFDESDGCSPWHDSFDLLYLFENATSLLYRSISFDDGLHCSTCCFPPCLGLTALCTVILLQMKHGLSCLAAVKATVIIAVKP